MSLSKGLAILAVMLFAFVAIVGIFKKATRSDNGIGVTSERIPSEIELVSNAVGKQQSKDHNGTAVTRQNNGDFLEVDRIDEFFNTGLPKFPIVETITYKSKVPWKQGRPAWIVDYASHYGTSRHFIARSLNKGPDYDTQKVVNGDHFNVFRSDKNIQFHLVVDISKAKMRFYYYDVDADERMLVKTYSVGIGKPDSRKASRFLTPKGKYSIGNNIAVYRPGMRGIYNGENTEMIRVFGTRWIPFGEEIFGATEPADGYGIHGVPWRFDNAVNRLMDDSSSIGKYESDGCLRLLTEDIEELFSIIITKPAFIEIVDDFYDAMLPGREITDEVH